MGFLPGGTRVGHSPRAVNPWVFLCRCGDVRTPRQQVFTGRFAAPRSAEALAGARVMAGGESSDKDRLEDALHVYMGERLPHRSASQ
jgi:hypothetical protein